MSDALDSITFKGIRVSFDKTEDFDRGYKDGYAIGYTGESHTHRCVQNPYATAYDKGFAVGYDDGRNDALGDNVFND